MRESGHQLVEYTGGIAHPDYKEKNHDPRQLNLSDLDQVRTQYCCTYVCPIAIVLTLVLVNSQYCSLIVEISTNSALIRLWL